MTRPEAAIVAAVAAARHDGATQVLADTQVTDVVFTAGGVRIETPTASVHARQAIVTAGVARVAVTAGLVVGASEQCRGGAVSPCGSDSVIGG